MVNPEIPGRIQMEWFIPVEIFRRKSNTFRGITGRKSAAPKHPCLHFLFISSTPFLTEVHARLSTLESLG